MQWSCKVCICIMHAKICICAVKYFLYKLKKLINHTFLISAKTQKQLQKVFKRMRCSFFLYPGSHTNLIEGRILKDIHLSHRDSTSVRQLTFSPRIVATREGMNFATKYYYVSQYLFFTTKTCKYAFSCIYFVTLY